MSDPLVGIVGVAKQLVDQRGLAVIDVRDDRDVSELV